MFLTCWMLNKWSKVALVDDLIRPTIIYVLRKLVDDLIRLKYYMFLENWQLLSHMSNMSLVQLRVIYFEFGTKLRCLEVLKRI